MADNAQVRGSGASPWDAEAPEANLISRINAAGLNHAGLEALVKELGEPGFRARQIYEGLYVHRYENWESFSTLPKALRARLGSEVELRWPEIVESASSEDGSTKHAFRLGDGALIEGVHMPYAKRRTLCLSSQVGCAMGCTYCATGQMGIVRNLNAAEIVGQVVAMLNTHGHVAPEPVNLVFMGMGEPLHNLDHVMEAFAILTDPKGIAIPPWRVTLSTVGLVRGIQRLGTYPKRPRLAVSLSATTDEVRSKIMPVNRAWNLEALAQALMAFPLERDECITVEYVLLKGLTDSLEDGRRLATFCKRFPSKVNLIPYNEHEGNGYEPPVEARINELCRLLSDTGLTVSVRRSRGQDAAGACGQLARASRSQSSSFG